jgi:hypothetical protein
MQFNVPALLVFLFSLVLGGPAAAGDALRKSIPLDKVELKKGRPVEGTVLLIDDERIVLRVKGRDKLFLREDIRSIKARAIDVPAALHLHANLKPDDVDRRLQLARDFKIMGLPLEARLLLWEVLLLDPKNEEAHLGLEHRRSGKRWLVPVGKRWQPLDTALAMHTKFKDAWQLPTSHFNLRTDLPLAEALRFAWMLEGAYYALHELLGSEIGLYHVIDPIELWIYTSLSDFPNQTRSPGFFSPGQRCAYTLYDSSTSSVQIHEMVHAMLYYAKETMGNKPVIPGWLDEGLAEYLARAIDPLGMPLEGVGNLLGHTDYHFKVHSQSKKPYGLKRSLTLSTGDFHSDNLQAEKYAAAYTLTHYLLHGESGEHRAAFIEFLRSAMTGKATSQAFKKALKIKRVRDFDKAWAEYSKVMAEA